MLYWTQFWNAILPWGNGVAQLVRLKIQKTKVQIPSGAQETILSFSESKILCWLAVGVPNPCVYAHAQEWSHTHVKLSRKDHVVTSILLVLYMSEVSGLRKQVCEWLNVCDPCECACCTSLRRFEFEPWWSSYTIAIWIAPIKVHHNIYITTGWKWKLLIVIVSLHPIYDTFKKFNVTCQDITAEL